MIQNKVIIADVSFWQDDDYTPYKIDFEIAWRNGLDGVILRAGQNTWIDEDYLDYCSNADRARLPRGAYWFFDSRVSPIPQADLFADIVELSGGVPSLGIWGDYEEHYGGVYGGEANFKIFMDRLQSRFPGKLIGVYTGPAYWKENTTSTGRTYFKKFPLWIANYKVATPSVPAPWETNEWKIWQYTAEGDGPAFGAESQEIDLNFFNGSLEQYKAYFEISGYQPYNETNNGETMYKCKIKETATPYVNLRTAPEGVDIGDMYPNEEFDADTIAQDSKGRDWLHSIKPGKVGYVLASLCYYEKVDSPPPTGETNLLEVYINGVLKYREMF